jgi:hypothetical protein
LVTGTAVRMTKIWISPTNEVAGSAATSITRFERILRNLKEKRADMVVNASHETDASHIFVSRHRRMRQKMCGQKTSAEFLSLKFVMPNSNNVLQLTFDPRFCIKRPANFD